MTRKVPRSLRLVCLVGAMCTLGSKCVAYDERLATTTSISDDSDDDGDDDTGPTTCNAEPTYTVTAMRTAACVGLRCASQKVASFWEDVWEDYDVVRILSIHDSGYTITDEAGSAADLTFEQGIPVTLTIRNSGLAEVSRAYDITAPLLFRRVAWSHIETTDGAYEAPTFDVVQPTYVAGVQHDMVLRFVPIERDTFDMWSSRDVVNGSDYAAIAAGETSPDLTTGDAGNGLKTTLTVTGASALTLFNGVDVDRDTALDRDARRLDSDPVWNDSSVITIIIDAVESVNPDTGADVFKFNWSSLQFSINVGHIVDLRSTADNKFQHNFTALGLLRGSVMRELSDSQGLIRASYIESANISAGKEVRMYIVPTIAARYHAYCQLGMVFSSNGQPDLTSGHAGAGMADIVEVVP